MEDYQCGALSRGQVGRRLEFNIWETEAFLEEKQAYPLCADSALVLPSA